MAKRRRNEPEVEQYGAPVPFIVCSHCGELFETTGLYVLHFRGDTNLNALENTSEEAGRDSMYEMLAREYPRLEWETPAHYIERLVLLKGEMTREAALFVKAWENITEGAVPLFPPEEEPTEDGEVSE